MLGWGWGVAGLVAKGENKWEMKKISCGFPTKENLG